MISIRVTLTIWTILLFEDPRLLLYSTTTLSPFALGILLLIFCVLGGPHLLGLNICKVSEK